MIHEHKKSWAWIALAFLIMAAAITAVISVSGCASTTIETPWGLNYLSSRDSQVDQIYYESTKKPDGTEITIVEINGARGKSSSVIDAQTEFFRAAIEAAISAGLKATPGG